VRKLLLTAASLAFLWSGFVYATGGFALRIGGIWFRSRDPSRPFVICIVLLILQAAWFRDAFTRDTDRLAAALRRNAARVGLVAALLLGAHAVYFGTFSVGGADAYGYVSQAYGWARGELPKAYALPITLPFPASDLMLTTLGYRVGPQPHTAVPTYAPGLPLMMAPALVVGPCGPFLVVPLCAVLFAWLTFKWGRAAAGGTAGAIAAIVILTSPIVLYQAVAPMSDVPAGALWTGAALASLRSTRRGALATGGWLAAGLLVRPNLLLLALVPLGQVAWTATGRERWIRVALVLTAIVPVAAFIGVLNATWYGAPWNSGYGSAAELYSLDNLRANLELYPTWLLKSQSAWVLVGLVSLLPFLRRDQEAATIRVALLMAIVCLLCYVGYSPFEVWWYLRFMMPAMGAIAVLIGAGVVTVARRIPRPWGQLAAAIVVWMIVVNGVLFGADAGVFGGIKAAERRYVEVGSFVARALPDNALIFSMQHSGSLRFYGGRLTIRYDFLDKDWAGRAASEIERAGYHPYMVVDDWEAPYVRGQFGLAAEQPLPWRVLARMRELGGVTVFDMSTNPDTPTPVSLEPGSAPRCPARLSVIVRRR
jgi:hypothetical protein